MISCTFSIRPSSPEPNIRSWRASGTPRMRGEANTAQDARAAAPVHRVRRAPAGGPQRTGKRPGTRGAVSGTKSHLDHAGAARREEEHVRDFMRTSGGRLLSVATAVAFLGGGAAALVGEPSATWV